MRKRDGARCTNINNVDIPQCDLSTFKAAPAPEGLIRVLEDSLVLCINGHKAWIADRDVMVAEGDDVFPKCPDCGAKLDV